jgi:hypothetical protein
MLLYIRTQFPGSLTFEKKFSPGMQLNLVNQVKKQISLEIAGITTISFVMNDYLEYRPTGPAECKYFILSFNHLKTQVTKAHLQFEFVILKQR